MSRKQGIAVAFKTVATLLMSLWAATSHATTELYYVHTDHLGTPQVMTDKNQDVVWKRSQTPFGETVEESGTLEQPLRFPGQYQDRETGFSYNYFRDYDPSIGRYIQSDPIGLSGGLNTYAYAGGNSIISIDPLGLNWWKVLPRNMQQAARNLPRNVLDKWKNTPKNPKNRSNRHKNKPSDDVPSWARNHRPRNGEDGKGFAERALDEQYGGRGNWDKGPKDRGPGSEYSRIKKWGTRDFEPTPLPTDPFNVPGSPLFDPSTYDPWANPYLDC